MTDNTIPCITFLNGSGDVTITWTPQNKEAVIELVKEKLKQRYSFFVIKPRLLCFGSKRVPLTSIDQLRDGVKGLVIPDEVVADAMTAMQHAAPKPVSIMGVVDKEVTNALSAGEVCSVRQLTDCEAEGTMFCKDPEVIATSQTIAVRPITGG